MMSKCFFYDTCALLDLQQEVFNTSIKFYISNITLKELEVIKTSLHKDYNVKTKARRLLRLLEEYQNKYEVIPFSYLWNFTMNKYPCLTKDSNDSKIIFTALKMQKKYKDLYFVTNDLSCRQLAKAVGLQTYNPTKQEEYKGFKVVSLNEEELAQFYQKPFYNHYELKVNQYLIIQNEKKEIIDSYKWDKEQGMIKVPYNCFESKMFGKVKPQDEYQKLAMDSLKTNQITMLRGAAGTGKSYLTLGYLFSQLEKGKIDKIIIFCNTVATSGSAKLGFYPGSRTEKLLDSQIGNFLTSKIGGRIAVEKMIEDGQIELIPMSDIRGYDTTGLNAGIYITEAQNFDVELMKLALQRIGKDSICILDGDSDTQVDSSLYAGINNGMRRVSEIFKGDSLYGEVTLKTIRRSHIAEMAQLM